MAGELLSAAVPESSSYVEDQQEAIARGTEEADWEELSGQTGRQDLRRGTERRETDTKSH